MRCVYIFYVFYAKKESFLKNSPFLSKIVKKYLLLGLSG